MAATQRPSGGQRDPSCPAGGASPAPAIPAAADPWKTFAVAVLAWHRRLDFTALDPPRAMCSCGVLEGECAYRGIAARCGLIT